MRLGSAAFRILSRVAASSPATCARLPLAPRGFARTLESMARVAQLTDLHLLEPRWADRPGVELVRLAFLTSYRPLAAERRIARARAALQACVDARPDHVLLTGDLTEDGGAAQWALLAELLHESGLPPAQVTIVPGNHDAYRGKRSLAEAFSGPLAAYAATSRVGQPIDLGGASVLPLDSTIDQHYVRAAGELGSHQRAHLDLAAAEDRPVLVAQHHPPIAHARTGLGWFQELVDLEPLADLLRRRRNVHVAHGHVHRHADHVLPGDRFPRVFSAHATVQHAAPLRLYDVDARGVRPR